MNDSDDSTETPDPYATFRRPVVVALFLSFAVPSVFSSLLLIIFFALHWSSIFLRSLHYHVIFLLSIIALLYTTTDLPFSITFFHLGEHPYRSIPFCLWWYWWDYSLLSVSLFVTANASIQRHMLTFHFSWVCSRKRRLLLHYLPFALSIVYPPTFYFVFIYFYPCEVYFNPADGWCASPCYIEHVLLFNIDWFVNTVLPVFVLVLANLVLVIRVCRSMKRIRLENARLWQRQKKLTLQLFAFSSLYVLVWFPTTCVAILRALLLPNLYNDLPDLYYIFYLIYFVCPLQSFLCVFAVPELIEWMKVKLKRLLPNSIVEPANVMP